VPCRHYVTPVAADWRKLADKQSLKVSVAHPIVNAHWAASIGPGAHPLV